MRNVNSRQLLSADYRIKYIQYTIVLLNVPICFVLLCCTNEFADLNYRN